MWLGIYFFLRMYFVFLVSCEDESVYVTYQIAQEWTIRWNNIYVWFKKKKRELLWQQLVKWGLFLVWEQIIILFIVALFCKFVKSPKDRDQNLDRIISLSLRWNTIKSVKVILFTMMTAFLPSNTGLNQSLEMW